MMESLQQLTPLIVLAIAVLCAADDPTARIAQGDLQGSLMTSHGGRTFAAFRAIPYAKPPVGELRFKAPQPAAQWSGVLNASADAPICSQKTDLVANAVFMGQEDCLYLNVYTHRVDNTSQELLPVMVYIHGGGWFSGGGHSYLVSPANLMDKDIVLVIFNYRLGVLGFLSTGDSAAPGNFALKDQVLALRWVRDNAEAFGGDPNAVTIFGQSAGSGSVHLHLLSPASTGLFHRAISESGMGTAAWAMPTADSLDLATRHGRLVGCVNGTSQQLVDCLRTVDDRTLVEATSALKIWSVDPLTLYRLVVEPEDTEEEPFLVRAPLDILRDAVSSPGTAPFVSVPWMTGAVRNEGIIRAVPILSDASLLADLNSRLDELMPQLLELNSSVVSGDSGLTAEELWARIKVYYFPQEGGESVVIGDDNSDAFVDLYGDRSFLHALHRAALYHRKAGHQDIFTYSFEYRGALTYASLFANTTKDYGVSHCDDLLYLLPSPAFFPQLPDDHPDWKVVDALVNLWTNFATFGRPTVTSEGALCASTVEDLNWSSISSSSDNSESLPYLQIAASDSSGTNNSTEVLSFCMMDDLLKDRMEFWDSLPLIENTLDQI